MSRRRSFKERESTVTVGDLLEKVSPENLKKVNASDVRDSVEEPRRTTTNDWKCVRRVSEENKLTGGHCTYRERAQKITKSCKN